MSSYRNGCMTHPKTPPKHALSPDTWGSDRDCQTEPGNDHIHKHMGGMISLKRRSVTPVLALLGKYALSMPKCTGEMVAVQLAGFSAACSMQQALEGFQISLKSQPQLKRHHTNTGCRTSPVEQSQTLLEVTGREQYNLLAPKWKAECALHALFLIYPLRGVEFAMQIVQANVHWLVYFSLVNVEHDWLKGNFYL